MKSISTEHRLIISDSRDLSETELQDESIDLTVTSPPYPMIKMWDELFSGFSGDIGRALDETDGNRAFELMHLELDRVWYEVSRLTKPGGIACVNIGDAVRTVNKRFRLYPNHGRIIDAFVKLGFDVLPLILWCKPTNAPNKFMGSGMFPAGAYVTLEHEYILVFRKGGKRLFLSEEERRQRRESGYFWEERNIWFSDQWNLRGTGQTLGGKDIEGKELRKRSAAYPYELAERLISMYSLSGDTIFDPFMGTGTTCRAAAALGRNSIGVEIEPGLSQVVFSGTTELIDVAREKLEARVANHIAFIAEYTKKKGEPKYINENHGFPVVTAQEKEIKLRELIKITRKDELSISAEYASWSPGLF